MRSGVGELSEVGYGVWDREEDCEKIRKPTQKVRIESLGSAVAGRGLSNILVS